MIQTAAHHLAERDGFVPGLKAGQRFLYSKKHRHQTLAGTTIYGGGLQSYRRRKPVRVWGQNFVKCVVIELSGNAIYQHDECNRLIKDDNFIWLANACENAVDFTFPERAQNLKWKLIT